ncbi:MAG TPA: hypothetical protein VGP92_08515 [Acidimicrobiia bacterium]|jgi:hypothetical protein|nr:hypothetical protein [Acidimicrobiia bacterium]
MSPAKGRKQFVQARPRAEVFAAVAVGTGIVVATALLIWLIRPGSPGVPGEGGLLSRQPRVTILLVLSAIALASFVSFILRRRHPPRIGTRGALAVGTAGVVVLAVAAGIFWPDGVVRHWPKRPKLITPASSVPVSVPSTTKVPTPTTKPGTSTTVRTNTTVAAPTTSKGG